MKVNQIASVLNTLNKVMVGTESVFADDLSNIVDAGAAVLDFTSDANGANFDNYIGKLIDQVGKVIFVDRAYTSQAPDIMKDSACANHRLCQRLLTPRKGSCPYWHSVAPVVP